MYDVVHGWKLALNRLKIRCKIGSISCKLTPRPNVFPHTRLAPSIRAAWPVFLPYRGNTGHYRDFIRCDQLC